MANNNINQEQTRQNIVKLRKEHGYTQAKVAELMGGSRTIYNGIENGKVNFDFNGLAPNEYGWWYLEGGKVDFSYHGLVEYGGDFWYVDGGNLKFDYYGLAQGTYGWWVVEGGRVNFDYTGWYTYKGNTYTIVEGKVQQSVVYDD